MCGDSTREAVGRHVACHVTSVGAFLILALPTVVYTAAVYIASCVRNQCAAEALTLPPFCLQAARFFKSILSMFLCWFVFICYFSLIYFYVMGFAAFSNLLQCADWLCV